MEITSQEMEIDNINSHKWEQRSLENGVECGHFCGLCSPIKINPNFTNFFSNNIYIVCLELMNKTF